MYKHMQQYKDKFGQIQQENSNLNLEASRVTTLQSTQGYPTYNLAKVLVDMNLKEVQLRTLKDNIKKKYEEIMVLHDIVNQREQIIK